MDDLAERLHDIELFSQLKLRALRRVARLFEPIVFDRDDYLTHQGEPGDRFFLLTHGRATVWHTDSNGMDRQVRLLQPGDHFGVTSLFLEAPRDVTVRVERGARLLALERAKLTEYGQDFPADLEALVLPAEIERRLKARRFDWMTLDETTEFYATKTYWALLGSQLLPAVVILALVAAAVALRNVPTLALVLGGLGVLGGGAFALLRWLDWRNDYYVITNKRIFHRESRLPSLQVTVDQAPLHQIQNVTMLKPNPFAKVLGFGSLEVQTAGRSGSILFRDLDNPEHCQQVIYDLLERARSLARASERDVIRQVISQQLQGPPDAAAPPVAPVPHKSETADPDDDTAGLEQIPSPLASWAARLASFLPHFRQERGQTVIWHKHPFVLIKATALPAIVLVVTIGVGAGWAALGGSSFSTVVLVLFVVWCLSLTWLLWMYEDWRNDLFQMSGSHLIDIDRLPLGFRERRRQAALEQVQNINVDIPNIWARLFNYGNVVIETAGATGDLTFEWVMNPRAVQAEISARIDAVRTRQREAEATHRRDEMAHWFAVYHQMRERKEI